MRLLVLLFLSTLANAEIGTADHPLINGISYDVHRIYIESSGVRHNDRFDYVLAQLKKLDLPEIIAVIPIAESNYKDEAVSTKGAAGAWQLMPQTALDYGLSNQGRFNFIDSTDVALRLLKDLYQQFGDWQLSFAAYNCGSSCVQNALKIAPNATSIDELALPKETKDYVHKINQLSKEYL